MEDDVVDVDTGKYYKRGESDKVPSDAQTSSVNPCQQHCRQQQQQQHLRPGPRRRGLIVRIRRQGVTFTRRLVKLLGLAEFRLRYFLTQTRMNDSMNASV